MSPWKVTLASGNFVVQSSATITCITVCLPSLKPVPSHVSASGSAMHHSSVDPVSPAKALALKVVTVLGRVMVASAVQPLKALAPMVAMPSGRVMLVRAVLPAKALPATAVRLPLKMA